MNERLIDGLMHLFAILARDGKVTREEQEVVTAYLNQHLSHSAVETSLKRFQAFSRTAATEHLAAIAAKVSKDLSLKQKYVVLTRLIEMINADHSISRTEHDQVMQVSEAFGLAEEEFELLFNFVCSAEPYLIASPRVLCVGQVPEDASKLGREVLPVFHFSGNLGVLRLPDVESYLIIYKGNAELTMNGQAMLPGRVYFLANGSVIRGQRTDPVYYSDVVGRFLREEGRPPAAFVARDVFYRFPNGRVGLRSVNLEEESGKLVALMGASGSGKSTLLNVLNGSLRPSQGQVTINGINLHTEPQQLQGVIGYVSQDDLLMEDLTVWQNLYLNAKLCFHGTPEEDITARVDRTLHNLGLWEARHLKVGSPLRKYISGGQRKRLNIALELIREPDVLFVDEPTSGLSSRDSENIMDLLRELAIRGKLVFVVIHQPSSDIFKMFDKLFILDVGGYPVYYGNPTEGVTYFKQLTGQIDSESAECPECGNVNPEQIFNILETRVLDEEGNFTDQRRYKPDFWYEAHMQRHGTVPEPRRRAPPEPSLRIPPWVRQAFIFLRRDVLSKVANRPYLLITFLEAPVLAMVLASLLRYYNTDDASGLGYTLYHNLNLPAYLFIGILVALFLGLTVSAEEILRDQKIRKREKFLHLSRSAYLLAKVGVLVVVSAVQSLTFVLLGNAILGIPADHILPHWAVLFSTALFANLLGLNISATFDSAVTIYILVPILLIPQIILSGVLVKFDKLNPGVTQLGGVPVAGNLMASRWAYEALAVHQFTDNAYMRPLYAARQQSQQAAFKKDYWLPRLRTELNRVQNYHTSTHPDTARQVAEALVLLRNELPPELARLQVPLPPVVQQLTPAAYESNVGQDVDQLLDKLEKLYIRQANAARRAADDAVATAVRAAGSDAAYEALKLKHHNEALEELVTNQQDINSIIQYQGRLIANADPVYRDPSGYHHALDFSAHFFAPTKHFAGRLWPTLVFNLWVLWSMVLVLYAALYYEAFRRLFAWLGRLTRGGRP